MVKRRAFSTMTPDSLAKQILFTVQPSQSSQGAVEAGQSISISASAAAAAPAPTPPWDRRTGGGGAKSHHCRRRAITSAQWITAPRVNTVAVHAYVAQLAKQNRAKVRAQGGSTRRAAAHRRPGMRNVSDCPEKSPASAASRMQRTP